MKEIPAIADEITIFQSLLKILKKSMVENSIEPKPIIVQPLTPVWIRF